MSVNGTAHTEYASLSGKIRTLVIDKTLTISGAAADSKAVGDKIDNINAVSVDLMEEMIGTEVTEQLKQASVLTVDNLEEVAEEVIENKSFLTSEDIASICV